MPTKFTLTRDINGYNGYGLIPTDYKVNVTLTANTDTTITVPSSSSLGGGNTGTKTNPRLIAIFYVTPGAEVWFALNVAAAVPAGATFALTSSEGNPSAWEVVGGQVIHCLTAGTNVSVGVKFYWLT